MLECEGNPAHIICNAKLKETCHTNHSFLFNTEICCFLQEMIEGNFWKCLLCFPVWKETA